jgi:hypothetical protein
MDYDLDHEQQALVDAVSTLLERQAGPTRARTVLEEGDGYDRELMGALVEAGFADTAEAGAGMLEAVLVAERVAAAVGCVPYAARAIVAPELLEAPLPEVVVLLEDDPKTPVRFAQHATVLLGARDDAVLRYGPQDVEIVPVDTLFGFPMAMVRARPDTGEVLAGVTPGRLRELRHVALAAELVGCMGAALELTVEHLKEREQFGAPLGTLQALQHRVAELFYRVEGAKWLTRRAAAHDAPGDESAAAVTAATAVAATLVRDTHQLSGAMGLTREYDLYLWTLRAAALRLEAGGVAAHAQQLAQTRWGDVAPVRLGEVA